MSGAREKGQSLAEYLGCCALLVLVLLLPYDGESAVVTQLAQAVGQYVRGISFLLSLS